MESVKCTSVLGQTRSFCVWREIQDLLVFFMACGFQCAALGMPWVGLCGM